MERIVSINNIFIVKVCTAPMFLLLLSHKRRIYLLFHQSKLEPILRSRDANHIAVTIFLT